MLRKVALLGSLVVVLSADPAAALFHLAHISEIGSGVGGNPDLQYVEITVTNNSQHLVTNTRLTVFGCDGSGATVLLRLPNDLPDPLTAARSWIMASPDDATFFAATGIHPNFTFPPGIPADCGMVCWGAPGILAPDPDTWNPALLVEGSPPQKNYVDCVAYGDYTGPMLPGTGTPTALVPNNATHALTRVSDTDNTATDFTYACPTPKNFAGITGTFGECTQPPQQPLLGKKLVLKTHDDEPEKDTVTLLSKDPAADLGGGNGSPDDPTLNPSSFRVYALGGDYFDTTYELGGTWQYIGDAGDNLGYKYNDRALAYGAIKTVVVKPGKVVKVVGRGTALAHTLVDDPTPVRALLMLGGKTYCLEFGGTRTFTPSVSYKALGAPRPPLAACLP